MLEASIWKSAWISFQIKTLNNDLKIKISNTPQEEGKYQLKIEVDDTVNYKSEPYEWKMSKEVSTVGVDFKDTPAIFGELRKLKFWALSDPEEVHLKDKWVLCISIVQF